VEIVGAPDFSTQPIYETRIRIDDSTPYVAVSTGADSSSAVVELYTLSNGNWLSLGTTTDTAVWSDYGRLSIAFDGATPFLSWCSLYSAHGFYDWSSGALTKLQGAPTFSAYYANTVECGPQRLFTIWSDNPAGDVYAQEYDTADGGGWGTSETVLTATGTFPYQVGGAYPTISCEGNTLYAAYEKGQWAASRDVEVQSLDLTAASPTWSLVGASAFATNIFEPTLVADSTGAPVVIMTQAITSSTNNGVQHPAFRFDGASWQPLGNASDLTSVLSSNTGRPQILAAADGSLYAVYGDAQYSQNFQPADVVTVARFANGVWTKLGSIHDVAAIDEHSAAIAPDGSLYVAYRDRGLTGTTNALTVVRFMP
jgi:hypothetical protein